MFERESYMPFNLRCTSIRRKLWSQDRTEDQDNIARQRGDLVTFHLCTSYPCGFAGKRCFTRVGAIFKNALAQAFNCFRSGCQLQKIVEAKVLHVDGPVVDFQGFPHFDHDGFKSSQSGPFFQSY